MPEITITALRPPQLVSAVAAHEYLAGRLGYPIPLLARPKGPLPCWLTGRSAKLDRLAVLLRGTGPSR